MSKNDLGALLDYASDRQQQYLKAVLEHGSQRKAAKALGCSQSSISEAIEKVREKFDKNDLPTRDTGEKVEFNEKDNSAILVTVNRKIVTAEDAMDYAKVDPSVWEIERFLLNKYEQGSKRDDGRVNLVELWQVKVWLRRRRPKYVDRSLATFGEYIRRHAPATPSPRKRKKVGDRLLVWSPVDVHFGKRCWGVETGTDYDSSIAKRMFLNACDDSIEELAHMDFGRVMIPIGHDFYNVNNWENTTARGTPQDVDDRFHYTFQIGKQSINEAIERLLKVAPVTLLWIPGNHDPATSYYLCAALADRFHKSKHVDVDLGPSKRKMFRWGTTMLVNEHGDSVKAKDMAMVVPTVYPQDWAETTWREVLTGHVHHRKSFQLPGYDEHNGLVVRALPSISGIDRYHWDHGFVGGSRAVETYVYSKEAGFKGMHNSPARD